MKSVIFFTLIVAGLAAEVCYDPCGCFDDDPPFDDRPLPTGPDNGNNIIYTLFSPEDPIVGTVIVWDENGFEIPAGFDDTRNTDYLFHGWTDSPDSEFEEEGVDIPTMRDIKDTIIEHWDRNVILTDWSEGAAPQIYRQAASNTRVVGACSAVLAETLQGLDFAHCVGHSLGGHVCGYFGNYTDGALAWISALDPAGPAFYDESTELRLDRTDAQFVDVTHTNSYQLVGASGMALDIGHADFYPHMGSTQAPCVNISCDHHICKSYYESSIAHHPDDCDFMGFPCTGEDEVNAGGCNTCSGSGCQSMGWWSYDKMTIQGAFYLESDPDYPYCQH